jgi:subfamily B ATP-binding cassette protein MsbA
MERERHFDERHAAVYRRAVGYFAPDARLVAVLVVLIGMNVAVGLLEAWPLAILVDRVLTHEPRGDWIHDAFLALVPASKPG